MREEYRALAQARGRGGDVDAALGRFLTWVRPRSRTANLLAYEDAVVALDDYMRERRRSVRRLAPTDVRHFIGYWALRRAALPHGRAARRFCAAVHVLVRWLSADLGPRRAPALRAAALRGTRTAARAAEATELLSRSAGSDLEDDDATPLDGYWVVTLRGAFHAVVRGIGTRDLIGPVLLPREVLRIVPPGAVINMRLVHGSHGWRVLEHGPCYPPAALPALRQALRRTVTA